MKTVTVQGKVYLLTPGKLCRGCAFESLPLNCLIKHPELRPDKSFAPICSPRHNKGQNHILRLATPEERAEVFAQKVSEP